MEQKKSRYLILFPKSAYARMILGAWWIAETILIETPLFYAITTPAEQQLLGPINILYYISSLFLLPMVLYVSVSVTGSGVMKDHSRNLSKLLQLLESNVPFLLIVFFLIFGACIYRIITWYHK